MPLLFTVEACPNPVPPPAPLPFPPFSELVNTKRVPAQPRAAFTLKNVTFETITPIPYDIVKEGLQT